MTSNLTARPGEATQVGDRPPKHPQRRSTAPQPPRRWLPKPSSALVAVVVAACTFLFVWPVVMVTIGAFRTGTPGLAGGTWTLDPLLEAYQNPSTWSTFGNSFGFAFAVTLLSKSLALIFAWIVARTDTPLRSLLAPVMLIVLAIPSLFFGISWGLLGDEYSGLLNTMFGWLTGTDASPFNIQSWPGLIFVSALKSTAIGFFLMLGPFMAMDRSQEEAASTAGASKIRIFFTIQIPALAPAVVSTVILGIITGLEYFELPLLLGTPADIHVFSTEIYFYINRHDPPEYSGASALVILLIVALFVLLITQRRILKGRQYTTVSGKMLRQAPWQLGRWRWVTSGLIITYVFMAVIMPMVQLLIGSFQPFLGVYDNFTLRNYREVFSNTMVGEAVALTAQLAFFGGFVTVCLAVLINFVLRHRGGAPSSYLTAVSWLPWAIPGTALALGMLWAYLSTPMLSELYGTTALVFIGLIVAVTPIAMRSVEPATIQISNELEEAAWISGSGKIRAYLAIVVRLIAPSFLSGWLLAGLLIAGNLAIPLMLSGAGNVTLSDLTYRLYNSGDAPVVAAIFCLIVAAVTAAFFLIKLLDLVLKSASRKLKANQNPTDGNVKPHVTHFSS